MISELARYLIYLLTCLNNYILKSRKKLAGETPAFKGGQNVFCEVLIIIVQGSLFIYIAHKNFLKAVIFLASHNLL